MPQPFYAKAAALAERAACLQEASGLSEASLIPHGAFLAFSSVKAVHGFCRRKNCHDISTLLVLFIQPQLMFSLWLPM